MTGEMDKAFDQKVGTCLVAEKIMVAMIQAEGGSSGHAAFFAQRAFAIAEEFTRFATEYLEGSPAMDDLTKVGLAPGIGTKP